MDKHTTWLAYIWALISGHMRPWTLNDHGALIGTFWVLARFWLISITKEIRAGSGKAGRRDGGCNS